MARPDFTSQILAYTLLVSTAPLYPIYCAINELGGDNNEGYGYYNFVPQMLFKPKHRHHPPNTAWPGTTPAPRSD